MNELDAVQCALDASLETWLNALEGVDGVFHLAWSTTPKSADNAPIADLTTNLAGMLGLMEAMRRSPRIPMVFVSSGGTVYGAPVQLPVSECHTLRPLGVYGASKASAEAYAMVYRRQFNVDTRILRLSNPYGPGQNVGGQLGAASVFAFRALSGQPIHIWGDGYVVRDYLFVDDTIGALLAMMNARPETFDEVDPIINIGSGQGVSLREIISVIETILDRTVDVDYQPARSFDVPASILDVSLAKQLLNWAPRTPFEVGMRKMLNYLSTSYDLSPKSAPAASVISDTASDPAHVRVLTSP